MTQEKKPEERNETQKSAEADGVEAEATEETYSLEALDEAAEELRREWEAGEMVDTAHTDGSTSNPHQAQEQGLVYDPPSDPPVLPSDDPQGASVATGFASSMEAANPDVRVLPDRVDNQDLDLEGDIRTVLRNNSETGHLTDVQVRVENGAVLLFGTVLSEEDIAIVQYMVRDLEGVRSVRNELQVGGV